MSERYLWLDVAKGIAIILMILGHTAIPNSISNFIYAFHMPLFFVASGFTTNWSKYSNVEFCKYKLKSLMFPFLIYSIIVLFFQSYFLGVNIREILYNGWGGLALWFIPVLYLSLVLLKLTRFSEKGYLFILFCVIILSCIASLLCHFKVFLSWNLSSVFIASVFILLGFVLRKTNVINSVLNFKYCFVYFLLTYFISSFYRLDIAWNQVNPFIFLIISAISGTLMVFTLSKLMLKHMFPIAHLFIGIGKETYVILAFSQTIIMLINHYFHINSYLKYCVLIVVMFMIVKIKNMISAYYLKLNCIK